MFCGVLMIFRPDSLRLACGVGSYFPAKRSVRHDGTYRPLPPHLDNPPFAVRRAPVTIHHLVYGSPIHAIVLNAHEPVQGRSNVSRMSAVYTAKPLSTVVVSLQITKTDSSRAHAPAQDKYQQTISSARGNTGTISWTNPIRTRTLLSSTKLLRRGFPPLCLHIWR